MSVSYQIGFTGEGYQAAHQRLITALGRVDNRITEEWKEKVENGSVEWGIQITKETLTENENTHEGGYREHLIQRSNSEDEVTAGIAEGILAKCEGEKEERNGGTTWSEVWADFLKYATESYGGKEGGENNIQDGPAADGVAGEKWERKEMQVSFPGELVPIKGDDDGKMHMVPSLKEGSTRDKMANELRPEDKVTLDTTGEIATKEQTTRPGRKTQGNRRYSVGSKRIGKG